ncbi:thioredoxin F-type, chloroplastic-like [Cynara cardunculus var. scolymus]|uniref:Thioredoxin n=1 Tax=Cynara cardunculus var. scolymus TaxID=59895 RepID=A0A103YEA2_CYNCS|nr:thioredoxin F-type, chloroplastic-like [Cynara cardunculus var. scolymus]KVI07476.1 Thioredoxin [Cynara cardunculus var. scolymus]
MALQIHHLRPPIPPAAALCSVGSLSSWPTKQSTIAGDLRRSFSLVKMIDSKTRKNKGLRYSVRVRSSLETSGSAAVVGQVTEVDKDTFWPIVNAAGDKTVVLDMYTQWCGPCKMIAPKIEELAEKYLDVVFLKLDCNQENKPLAKELGIKVVPTFKILKQGKIIKEVTGAKFDDLVTAMEDVRSS